MKIILTLFAFLISSLSFAQQYESRYDTLMDKAAQMLEQKDYCKALTFFKSAFKDTTRIGIYDLYSAAHCAVKCNEEKQALIWLAKSQQKGLGLKPGEVTYIAKDTSFLKLHKYSEWAKFISSMRQAYLKEQTLQEKQSEAWLKIINNNKIKPAINGRSMKCNPGFALYFTMVGTLRVPYMVYIPKDYNPAKPTKTVIFLHGGVRNTDSFDFKNPIIAKEPIFSIGDTFNTIVIYPFGRKDFGWVKQIAAFENIFTIVKKVESTYHVDSNKIFLGGMSNGGTATFWFASQRPSIFKGFYAFSAWPGLDIGPINFQNILPDKPLYTLNAKDDEVFNFDEVKKIYVEHKAVAKGWHFETLQSGGHGFLYQQNGKNILNNFFKQFLSTH